MKGPGLFFKVVQAARGQEESMTTGTQTLHAIVVADQGKTS
jgi:hypothetical protein